MLKVCCTAPLGEEECRRTIAPMAVCGTVFALGPPPTPGGAWTETILHAFGGAVNDDGAHPASNLVLGPNGELYGTTQAGGMTAYCGSSGCGTVFELLPPSSPGGSWTEVILHSFTGGSDGNSPNGLTLGLNGTLYGTTATGGDSNLGTIFELAP
jgi:uncharacterized repeat protein (TIGR03803 family)